MLIKKERALKISPPLKIPIPLSISHLFIAKVTMGISWTLQCYRMVKYQCHKPPSSLSTDDKAMLQTQDWAAKSMHFWFYVMTATHLRRRETTIFQKFQNSATTESALSIFPWQTMHW